MQKNLNKYIDHTLLRPDATQQEIEQLCQEGLQYQFASVCIHPTWVPVAFELLKRSSVKLCSVVGFPLGANTSRCKQREAAELLEKGVNEIDMVINMGFFKSKMYDAVRQDIEAVVKGAPTALIKVILETCLLSDEEKRIASLITVEAGAHYVKTSTGFSVSGATIADVTLMRSAVGPNFGVKASGGIKDRPTALAMIKAGASRLGTSSSVLLMKSLGNDMLSFIKKKG
jgi:deoxyribose-phosphate aldolase